MGFSREDFDLCRSYIQNLSISAVVKQSGYSRKKIRRLCEVRAGFNIPDKTATRILREHQQGKYQILPCSEYDEYHALFAKLDALTQVDIKNEADLERVVSAFNRILEELLQIIPKVKKRTSKDRLDVYKTLLPEDELRHLYVDKDMGTRTIGKIKNIPRRKVEELLIEYNIPKKVPIRRYEPPPPTPTYDHLFDLYWNQRLTILQIADHLSIIWKINVTEHYVTQWLQQYEIPIRKGGFQAKHDLPRPPYEYLFDLYNEKGFAVTNIAKLLSRNWGVPVYDYHVKKWLEYYNIPLRKKLPKPSEPLLSAKELKKLYWELGYTLDQLVEAIRAKGYHCMLSWIIEWMDFYKIPRRASAAARNRPIPPRPSYEELIDLYWNKWFSLSQIASYYEIIFLIKVTPHDIEKWFQFYKIKTRPQKCNKNEHPIPSYYDLVDLVNRGLSIQEIADLYGATIYYIRKWLHFFSIVSRNSIDSLDVPWEQWELVCIEIAKILLKDKHYKPFFTVDILEEQKVTPEFIIFDKNNAIEETIDVKWSIDAIRKKDREIHPRLSTKKRAIFWLLHGTSEVRIYKDDTIISVAYNDYNENKYNAEKTLILISSDDLICMLRERINKDNKKTIEDLINEIIQLKLCPEYKERQQKTLEEYENLLPEYKLRELYEIRGLGYRQISKMTDIPREKVRQLVIQYKIPIHGTKSLENYKTLLPENELRELYRVQRLKIRQISKMKNIPRDKVRQLLIDYNIPLFKNQFG